MRPVKLTNLSGEVMKVTWMNRMIRKRSQMACAYLVTLWMFDDFWWFLCSYRTSMKYQWTSLNVYWVLQIIELNGSCSRAMLNDQRVLKRVTWGRGWMTKASGVGERRKGRGELRRDCHHRVAALFVPTRMQQWYIDIWYITMIYMGEGAGGPFRGKNHVMSLGSPGIRAKARRL